MPPTASAGVSERGVPPSFRPPPPIGLSVRVLGRPRALSGADDLVLPVGARSRGCLRGTRPCLRWLDSLLLVYLELDRAEWLLSESGMIRAGALR